MILTAVRGYCRFRLSLANVCDLLAERGIDVWPRTNLSWVQKFGPLPAGRWAHLYRAVDNGGQVVGVLLREQCDLARAYTFSTQANRRRRVPPAHVVTDKHQASVRAVHRHARHAVPIRTGRHRVRRETTKAIERVRVRVKDWLRPLRGLQSITSGQRLLGGIKAI